MPPVLSGKVALFGAAGPVGAAAAQALAPHYTLRLTDRRLASEVHEPQSPGAPLPQTPQAPHEERRVDVTDYAQVLEAARGMDALINCTVVRPHLEAAFAVNMLGAYHVARAAVELGIKRVIHTGPYHMLLHHNADYWWDHAVPDDVPLHPGSDLYAVSKFLGGEITRVFAERHGLEVITFLYCHFMAGDGGDRKDGSGCGPFVTSWEDCGEAFLFGLRAATPPRPYEPFFICADVPHGKFPPHKAERLLGWRARHRFERLWTHPAA
jgi:nucleoside-diphosphate-sugar epimerase